MDKFLQFEFTRAADNKPIATIKNFPGEGVEMRPDSMRDFARVLLIAADECDQHCTKNKFKLNRQYRLTAEISHQIAQISPKP